MTTPTDQATNQATPAGAARHHTNGGPMNIGEELARLAREIWTWQSETFAGLMTVEGAVAKIRDECAEVLTADARMVAMSVQAGAEGVVAIAGGEVLKGAALVGLSGKAGDMATQGVARREELADVFFMLVQLAGTAGDSPEATVRWVFSGAATASWRAYSGASFVELINFIAAEAGRSPGRFAATAMLVPWGAACTGHGDLPHMLDAIRAKLEVNRARKWGARAADGTISHVKPASNGGEA